MPVVLTGRTRGCSYFCFQEAQDVMDAAFSEKTKIVAIVTTAPLHQNITDHITDMAHLTPVLHAHT